MGVSQGEGRNQRIQRGLFDFQDGSGTGRAYTFRHRECPLQALRWSILDQSGSDMRDLLHPQSELHQTQAQQRKPAFQLRVSSL